jgi:hypothetical protein
VGLGDAGVGEQERDRPGGHRGAAVGVDGQLPGRDGLDFPHARQAIKITRRRKDTATGRISRETVYAVTSLTSADASAQDLARLIREHWSIEAHHHAT